MTDTKYPNIIKFDIEHGPTRERILNAAKGLGLAVTHQDATRFFIGLASAADAYELGRVSMEKK